MLFNTDLLKTLFYHLFFFLIIGSYFLILTVITQVFNLTAELSIPTESEN